MVVWTVVVGRRGIVWAIVLIEMELDDWVTIMGACATLMCLELSGVWAAGLLLPSRASRSRHYLSKKTCT